MKIDQDSDSSLELSFLSPFPQSAFNVPEYQDNASFPLSADPSPNFLYSQPANSSTSSSLETIQPSFFVGECGTPISSIKQNNNSSSGNSSTSSSRPRQNASLGNLFANVEHQSPEAFDPCLDYYRNQYTTMLESDILDSVYQSFVSDFDSFQIESQKEHRLPSHVQIIGNASNKNIKSLYINTSPSNSCESLCLLDSNYGYSRAKDFPVTPLKSRQKVPHQSPFPSTVIESGFDSSIKSAANLQNNKDPGSPHKLTIPDLLSPNSSFSGPSPCATPMASPQCSSIEDGSFYSLGGHLFPPSTGTSASPDQHVSNSTRNSIDGALNVCSLPLVDTESKMDGEERYGAGPKFAFPVMPLKIGEVDPNFNFSEYDDCIDLDELLAKESKAKKKTKKTRKPKSSKLLSKSKRISENMPTAGQVGLSFSAQ